MYEKKRVIIIGCLLKGMQVIDNTSEDAALKEHNRLRKYYARFTENKII